MSGYRNAQFATTPGVFGGGYENASNEFTNPPFNYTASEVRMYNAGVNDTGFERDSTITVQLRRGFMKNLNTKLGRVGTQDAPDPLRLRFQFNPTTIQQQVEARQDMYLSVLQDPYQLTQPVAGSTSFSFELLFDRTHEVMNGGPKADITNVPGQPASSLSSGDAGDIGVLADLEVLYAIIGQGFSKNTLGAQFNIVKENARREYQRAIASGDPLFTWAEQTEVDGNTRTIYKEKSNFEKYFQDEFLNKTEIFGKRGRIDKTDSNINIGNAAFLVPMPVRIIFSALYMVDGYVMSSNVIFTKFNTHMVPIQCRVLLNIQAVYLGFARDKTFLSESISKSGAEAREDLESAEKLFNDFCKAYGKNLQTYYVTLGTWPGLMSNKYDFPPNSHPIAALYGTRGMDLSNAATLVFDRNTEPTITSGFPTSSGANKLVNYWDDGNKVTVSHTSKVSVYGPYPSQQAANSARRDPNKLVGEYTQSKSAGASDEWVPSNFDDVVNANWGMFSVSNRGNSSNTATNAASSMSGEEFLGDFSNGYFAFYADVEVTVATPDGLAKDTKTATQKQVFKGTDAVSDKPFKFTLPKCTEQKSSQADDNPYSQNGGN